MRFAIIGAGGIGGFLAAKLGAAGAELAILARGAHLEAIRERGLTLRHQGEEITVRPAAASDKGADLGQADVAIFAVKGQDLADAIDAARPVMGPETLALPFLNGVEAPDLLAQVYGPERALIGVAHISAAIAAPAIVNTAGNFANFLIGDLNGRQDGQGVAKVIAAFREAGIGAPDAGDMRVELWKKLAFLTALSGTTAGARATIGEVRATPEAWAFFRQLAEEVVAVGQAKGVAIDMAAVDHAMGFTAKLPEHIIASLAHDLSVGKPLETDWLNGAVARLGAEAGVATPGHAAVAALLAPWRGGGTKA